MKTSTLLPFVALLASSLALPKDLHERGFSFAFPTFPAFSFPGFPAATPTTSAKTTPLPTTPVVASTPKTTTTSATTTMTPSISPVSPTTATSTTSKAPVTTSSGSTSTGGDTENGVVNGECKELTVIFARGTSESGNVGTVITPMFSALRSTLGTSKVTIQGVDYPASAAGNANMGADGGPTMASLVSQALSQCPTTKIALSGYSQGAMVVHNAVSQQGVSPSNVAAVVLFGDPFNGQSVGGIPASEVMEDCASGDQVCNGSGTYAITAAHLSYGNDAQTAANFIIKTAGVS